MYTRSWIKEVHEEKYIRNEVPLPPRATDRLGCPDKVVAECVKNFAYSLDSP